MAGTTAGVVKDALVDALVAAPAIGGAGVQVSYGFVRNPEREQVVLGNVDWDEEEFVHLGARKRDELYRIGLFVFVAQPGETQQSTTERGLALYQAIEAVLLANPTLGGTVIVAEMAPRQVAELPTTDGTSVMVEGEVRVRARK